MQSINTKTAHKFSYGLFLLSAKDEKENACIINTAIQVTSEPYKVSIAVNKNNFTLEQILKTGAFNISVLSENCPFEIFKRFGFQSGKTVDKFTDFDAPISSNGLRYLDMNYANAFISCAVESTLDLGSHILVLGNVTEAEVLSDTPSVTYAYYLKNIKPKPNKPKEEQVVYTCQLCGHEYNESATMVPFDKLPDDWTCPACGMAKSEFRKSVAKPKMPKNKVWVCSVCGYIYDESVEKVPFEDLPSDWTCPLCKHPKSDFELQM